MLPVKPKFQIEMNQIEIEVVHDTGPQIEVVASFWVLLTRMDIDTGINAQIHPIPSGATIPIRLHDHSCFIFSAWAKWLN
jgi:hypothetical protein